MFNKKEKCQKCGKGIDKNSNFCNSCGSKVNNNFEKDFGMLGKADLQTPQNPFEKILSGGFAGGMLGKMLGGAMGMLEKEMKKEFNNSNNQNNQNNQLNSNVELFINGKRVNPQNVKVTKKPQQKQNPKKQEEKVVELPIFSKDKQKKFLSSKKMEPQTKIRRLSDQVIYEIEIPGVKKIEDLSIKPAGGSIEIKAVTKTKSYFKSIPLTLPLVSYSLEKDLLVLEFGVGN